MRLVTAGLERVAGKGESRNAAAIERESCGDITDCGLLLGQGTKGIGGCTPARDIESISWMVNGLPFVSML
jgi:hypothetical protein